MRKSWIQTLSNRKLEPLALTPEMVGPIEEIAHALAGEFRFTRQTMHRYSVAQHCVMGSELLPAAFAGAFLLHELSEVYLPDIAGPLKPSVRVQLEAGEEPVTWEELERRHTDAILSALNLTSLKPLIYSAEVKQMDLAMLAFEARELCGPAPEPWSLTVAPPAKLEETRLTVWAPDYAEQRFLQQFNCLFKTP